MQNDISEQSSCVLERVIWAGGVLREHIIVSMERHGAVPAHPLGDEGAQVHQLPRLIFPHGDALVHSNPMDSAVWSKEFNLRVFCHQVQDQLTVGRHPLHPELVMLGCARVRLTTKDMRKGKVSCQSA